MVDGDGSLLVRAIMWRSTGLWRTSNTSIVSSRGDDDFICDLPAGTRVLVLGTTKHMCHVMAHGLLGWIFNRVDPPL